MANELLPSAEELNKYAEDEIEPEVVARFNLENITHARLGGYNSRVVTPEIGFNETIRTTSIKGMWRWWLRAALAGAYCESGYVADREYIEMTTMRILGSNEGQSKFKIRISLQNTETPKPFVTKERIITRFRKGRYEINIPELGHSLPPRLVLLLEQLNSGDHENRSENELKTLGEELSMLYPPSSIKAKISIYYKGDSVNTDSDVAIPSVLLGLVLGGLGSITRRGFGHFRIKGFTSKVDTLSSIQSMLDKMQDSEPSSISEGLGLLRNFILDKARGIIEKDQSKIPNKRPLPSSACLCSDHFSYNIAVVSKKAGHEGLNDNDKELLRILGLSTTKNNWKRMDNRRFNAPGGQYKTWILGLPRFSENQKTGYEAFDEKGNRIERRPSAISLAPVAFDAQGRACVIVYGFKSLDWPKRIRYLPGGKRKDQPVKEVVDIPHTLESAMNRILKYLNGASLK